jgi:hypothetical protein
MFNLGLQEEIVVISDGLELQTGSWVLDELQGDGTGSILYCSMHDGNGSGLAGCHY